MNNRFDNRLYRVNGTFTRHSTYGGIVHWTVTFPASSKTDTLNGDIFVRRRVSRKDCDPVVRGLHTAAARSHSTSPSVRALGRRPLSTWRNADRRTRIRRDAPTVAPPADKGTVRTVPLSAAAAAAASRGHAGVTPRPVREIAVAWKGWTFDRRVDCGIARPAASPTALICVETERQQFRANGSRLSELSLH